MTRDEVLALYSPIRTGIQRTLKAATRACSDADVKRAAKQLGVWSSGRIEVPNETAIDMVADLALFEPNQRRIRAYDRFLRDRRQALDTSDLALAHRMQALAFRSSACF